MPASSPRNWARCCRCATATRRRVVEIVRAPRRAGTRRRAADDAGRAHSRGRADAPVALPRVARRRCSARGARRPGRCSRCATTRRARSRSTTGSSTRDDPGLSVRLTFEPGRTDVGGAGCDRRAVAPPRSAARIAILRDQGVNGEVEMAAAFDRAGFDAHDVHMSDVIAGGCRSPASAGSRRAAASRSATCSAAARAGPSRRSTTRGRATSSPRSSRGPTRSRSASATAAR